MTSRALRPAALPMGLVTLVAGSDPARVWRVAAVIAVAVNAAVTAAVAFAEETPPYPFDEVHHLLMARMVAGFPAPDGSGAGYYPLWGIMLAPVWWVADDPHTVYSVALAVGWAVGILTLWPLTCLLRRLRLTAPQAVVVAAVTSTLPARVAQADVVFSERVVFLCAVTVALAAFRLWERPTVVRAVLFAGAVGLLHFSHVRMLTVVLASGVWLLCFLLRRWWIALVGMAALIISYLLFDGWGAALDAALRRNDMNRGAGFLSDLAVIEPHLLLRAALGQTWEQIIGSFGLYAVGVVALAVWCCREVRHLRVGRACWLAGALVASTAVSVLTWAQPALMQPDSPSPRLDAWIYGRYVDPLTSLVCALGIAVVLRGIRTSTWTWAAAITTAVVAAVVRWVAPYAPVWGNVSPVHIGGATPWFWLRPDVQPPTPIVTAPVGPGSFWFWASAATVLALVLCFILRRRTVILAAVLIAATIAASVGVDRASNDYRAANTIPWSETDVLRDIGREFGPLDIAYDYGCGRYRRDTGIGMNELSFQLLPDATLEPYRPSSEMPSGADIVLSCVDAVPPLAAGGLRLDGFFAYSSVAWIMPGPLQDQLRARGMLVG